MLEESDEGIDEQNEETNPRGGEKGHGGGGGGVKGMKEATETEGGKMRSDVGKSGVEDANTRETKRIGK